MDVRRYAVIGVAMLTLCAVIGAGTVSLLPVPVGTRLAAAVIFAASGTVVAGTLLLPWARLPHQLLVIYPILGLGSLAVLGACTTGVGPIYLGFLVISFMVMGFSGSVPGVLALLPAGAVTWLLLNGIPDVAMSAALAVRLGIALAVWAAVGIVLAERSTEERHHRSDLVDDAHTDALTGLDNRRTLSAVLGAVHAGDVVVVVDIDEFREINTARGHGGGDAVLADFGRTVRVALRGGDHAIRQGGDEFILVLTAVGEAQVLAVLARLRDRWQDLCGPVTFSAGAAAFRPGETGQDTLSRADQCCYRAKAAGRDQWILDADTPPAHLPATGDLLPAHDSVAAADPPAAAALPTAVGARSGSSA